MKENHTHGTDECDDNDISGSHNKAKKKQVKLSQYFQPSKKRKKVVEDDDVNELNITEIDSPNNSKKKELDRKQMNLTHMFNYKKDMSQVSDMVQYRQAENVFCPMFDDVKTNECVTYNKSNICLMRLNDHSQITYDVFYQTKTSLTASPDVSMKCLFVFGDNLFEMSCISKYIKKMYPFVDVISGDWLQMKHLNQSDDSTLNDGRPTKKVKKKICFFSFDEFQKGSSYKWMYSNEYNDKMSTMIPLFQKHESRNQKFKSYEIVTNYSLHDRMVKEIVRVSHSKDFDMIQQLESKDDTFKFERESQFVGIERLIREQHFKYAKSCHKLYDTLENDYYEKIKMTYFDNRDNVNFTYLMFMDACIRIIQFAIIPSSNKWNKEENWDIVNHRPKITEQEDDDGMHDPFLHENSNEMNTILFKHLVHRSGKDSVFYDKRSMMDGKYSFLKNADLKNKDVYEIRRILLGNSDKMNQHWYFTLNDEKMKFVYDLLDHWFKSQQSGSYDVDDIDQNLFSTFHQYDETELLNIIEMSNSKFIAMIFKYIQQFIRVIHETMDPTSYMKMYQALEYIYRYINPTSNRHRDNEYGNYHHHEGGGANNNNGDSFSNDQCFTTSNDISKWKLKLIDEIPKYSSRALKILVHILRRFSLCHQKRPENNENIIVNDDNDAKMTVSKYNSGIASDNLFENVLFDNGSFLEFRKVNGMIMNDYWGQYNDESSKTLKRIMDVSSKHFTYYEYAKNVDAIYVIGFDLGFQYAPVLDDRCESLLEWFIIQKYFNVDKKKTKIPFFYYSTSDDRWRQCLLKSAKNGAYEWIDSNGTKDKFKISDLNSYSDKYLLMANKPILLNDMTPEKMESVIHKMFNAMDYEYQLMK